MNYIKDYNGLIKEDMFIDIKNKLRDSVHEILVNNLDYGKEMSISELSKKLGEINIDISEEILEDLLFKKWWIKKDYSIFKEEDKKWLDVWPYKKTVERKKVRSINPFGKGRRKIINKVYNYYNYDF